MQVGSVEREYAELAAQNDTDSREVDSLFADKQARLELIQQVIHSFIHLFVHSFDMCCIFQPANGDWVAHYLVEICFYAGFSLFHFIAKRRKLLQKRVQKRAEMLLPITGAHQNPGLFAISDLSCFVNNDPCPTHNGEQT